MRSMKKRLILLLLAFVIAAGCVSCADARKDAVKRAFSAFRGRYVFLVSKKEFALYVYDRNLAAVKKYLIAYGLNPDRKTKLHAGDDRTPEGEYHVVEILSMDADRSSPAYRKIRAMNGVYFRARDGHYRYGDRKADLGDNAYGPRFFLIDYPAAHDRARYDRALASGLIPLKGGAPAPIGHGIAIHGNNDSASIGHLATSGCIRMYNEDILELDRFVEIGTPVIISSD